jgi:hypothetical protein
LAFGGTIHLLQEQQKNMMEQVGQHVLQVWHCKNTLGGAGTQSSALAFGGDYPCNQTATEEWTGAGAPATKTITVS